MSLSGSSGEELSRLPGNGPLQTVPKGMPLARPQTELQGYLNTLQSDPFGGAENSAFDLMRILQVARRRWFTMAVVGLAVFGIAAFRTFRQKPTYQSVMTILVDKPQTVSLVDVQAQQERSSLATEVEILKSLPLLKEGIQRLSGDYRAEFDRVGSLDDSARLLLSRLNIGLTAEGAGVLAVIYNDSDPKKAQVLLQTLGETYVDYSLQDKRSKATSAIQFIEKQLPQAQSRLEQSALDIKNFQQQYEVPDPSALATSLFTTKQSLNQEIERLQISVDANRRRYAELQRQIGQGPNAALQNPDNALADTQLKEDTRYQTLVKQYNDLQADYALKLTQYTEEHPIIQDLKRQRDEVSGLMQAHVQQVLGDRAPEVIPALPGPSIPESGSVQRQLAQELVSVRTDLLVKRQELAGLQASAQNLAARFQQVPGLTMSYTELQRQFQLHSETVNLLLNKLTELRVAESQELSPWKVLNPASLPRIPVSPNIPKELTIGFIAAVVSGIGAALLVDRLDDRVRNREEVKTLTKLPILTGIPRLDLEGGQLINLLRGRPSAAVALEGDEANGGETVNNQYRYIPAKEALQALAINLRCLGASGNLKTTILTSSLSGEGKTTVNCGLAIALAELGARVLLIDTDLRRPSVHRNFEIPNARGLSTVLSSDLPWQEALYEDEYINSLHVLPGGPRPINPVPLLNSPKMYNLLKEVQEHYDYVLLDTPPAVGMADVLGLVPQVDAVMLLVGLDYTKRPLVERAVEILRSSEANLVGVVVNFVDQSHDDAYYYYDYNSYYYRKGDLPPAKDATPEAATVSRV